MLQSSKFREYSGQPESSGPVSLLVTQGGPTTAPFPYSMLRRPAVDVSSVSSTDWLIDHVLSVAFKFGLIVYILYSTTPSRHLHRDVGTTSQFNSFSWSPHSYEHVSTPADSQDLLSPAQATPSPSLLLPSPPHSPSHPFHSLLSAPPTSGSLPSPQASAL